MRQKRLGKKFTPKAIEKSSQPSPPTQAKKQDQIAEVVEALPPPGPVSTAELIAMASLFQKELQSRDDEIAALSSWLTEAQEAQARAEARGEALAGALQEYQDSCGADPNYIHLSDSPPTSVVLRFVDEDDGEAGEPDEGLAEETPEN